MEKGLTSRATFDAAVLEANASRSRLETAQANLNLARKALEQTVLVAPMDGVITATSGNVAQVIAAGQEVMRIASLDRPDAVFDVPEQIITTGGGRDQIVSLAMLSNSEIVANGRITEVSPMADPSTRYAPTCSAMCSTHSSSLKASKGTGFSRVNQDGS